MLIMFDEFVSEKQKTITTPYIEDSFGRCTANPLARLDSDIWSKRGQIAIKKIDGQFHDCIGANSIVKFIIHGKKLLLFEQEVNINYFVPLRLGYLNGFNYMMQTDHVIINRNIIVYENVISNIEDLNMFLIEDKIEEHTSRIESFVIGQLGKNINGDLSKFERLYNIRNRMLNTDSEGEKQACRVMYIRTIKRILKP